jgi:hypothetical protein
MTDTLVGLTVVTSDSEARRWCEDTPTIGLFDRFVVLDARGDSADTAYPAGVTEVHAVPARPAVEYVVYEARERIPHEWLFRIDPDEHISPDLVDAVREALPKVETTRVILLPFVYYVGDRPLRGGVWGGRRMIARIVHSSNITEPTVHASYRGEQYSIDELVTAPPRAVLHRWVRSLDELREKHERYLALEGASRLHDRGAFKWGRAITEIVRTTLSAFVLRRPWRDGTIGFTLAAEFLRYQTSANMAWRAATIRQATTVTRGRP